jgi:hypothetical protein
MDRAVTLKPSEEITMKSEFKNRPLAAAVSASLRYAF